MQGWVIALIVVGAVVFIVLPLMLFGLLALFVDKTIKKGYCASREDKMCWAAVGEQKCEKMKGQTKHFTYKELNECEEWAKGAN